MKKSLGKVWRERKSVYLCNPVTKQGYLKRTWASGRESEKECRKVLSMTEFIEKTGRLSTRKQVPKNTKRIESVDFFKGIESAGLNLKDKKYTKKSLILAQDER